VPNRSSAAPDSIATAPLRATSMISNRSSARSPERTKASEPVSSTTTVSADSSTTAPR
jgi:hypothetical protein